MQNKNYYDPLSGGVITNSFKEKKFDNVKPECQHCGKYDD